MRRRAVQNIEVLRRGERATNDDFPMSVSNPTVLRAEDDIVIGGMRESGHRD